MRGNALPVDKTIHDKQLIRYLLGQLPDDEAQRLDELSVEDDEFALRLQAVEYDLVDSYARGELSGETLEHFKSFYRNSPKRREKIAFAEALHAREIRTASSSARSMQAVSSQRSDETRVSALRSSPPWIFSVPRLAQWGFAAAAVAMAVLAGFLFIEVAQLKRQITEAESERAANDQRQQSVEKQLNEQRVAQTQTDLDRPRNETPRFDTMKSIAVLLMPQTRGAGQPVSISVPIGIDTLPLLLELESDEFPEYQVILKVPGSDYVVWSSAKLKAGLQGKNRLLSLSIPVKVLKQKTYVLEASGFPPKGAPEFISGYVFRVVLD